MNGFQKDLRTRILGVASHLEVTGSNNTLSDWQNIVDSSRKLPHVLASAPYITAQAMLSYDQGVQGAIVRGVLPAAEDKVADLSSHMKIGHLSDLRSGEFGIILGTDLAYSLSGGDGTTRPVYTYRRGAAFEAVYRGRLVSNWHARI
jgi:lipoprotein-releasing system permease protein